MNRSILFTWLRRCEWPAGAALSAPTTVSAAQSAPSSRPLRLIVPFTPGTGIDLIARHIGPKLSERLGRTEDENMSFKPTFVVLGRRLGSQAH